MATIKKIGLLGGSFNPAHNGHLEISKTALNELNLDEIWWVITSNNPFKDKGEYLPIDIRKSQAQQIIGKEKISIQEFEDKINSNYTIDLINHLQSTYEHNFVWLMGADNLDNFKQWKNHDEIVNNIHIGIFNRPSYEIKHTLQDLLGCDKNHIFTGNIIDFMTTTTPNIVFIKSTNNNASATEIRNKND